MFAKEKKVKRIIDCLPDEVADEVLKKKKDCSSSARCNTEKNLLRDGCGPLRIC